MASVTEAQQFGSPLAASLNAGIQTISQNQTVSFTPYVRQVMPLDGYVFWVNASLLSPAALAAAGLTSAAPVVVSGSLHFATEGVMEEDENIALHKMIFTSTERIAALAESAPNVLYIARWTYPGDTYSWQFSFSGRNAFYIQSGLHHYIGNAVYPAFQTQIIDTLAGFDQRAVVSNSLPAWLQLANAQALPLPLLPVNISVPLFPSFSVPDNLQPPYGTVHIEPRETRALQPVPYRDINNSHWQLCSDHVRITLYGLHNDEALTFLDMVLDFSLITGAIGLMNMPTVRDEKRPQQELAALAMKKCIDFEVSYYQQTMRQIAQQVIATAIPSISINQNPIESATVNWYQAKPVS